MWRWSERKKGTERKDGRKRRKKKRVEREKRRQSEIKERKKWKGKKKVRKEDNGEINRWGIIIRTVKLKKSRNAGKEIKKISNGRERRKKRK